MTESSGRLARIAGHPLTITAVGFLLTGIIGTYFSNRYSDGQRDHDRFLQLTEARRAAIQAFARTLYERRGRADMLASSLRRGAPSEELEYRKRSYDESYVQWERDLQANLFMIRSAIESEEYTDLEGYVEFQLVPILRAIDTCITAAYDRRTHGADPKPTLDVCNVGGLLSRSRDCAYAVTDQLFRLAVRTSPPIPAQTHSLRQTADSEIARRCRPA